MSTTRLPPQAQRRARGNRPRPPAGTDGAAALELPAPEEHELIEGPSREDLIRRRAYDLYQRNGCVDGHALDDWLAAEAELNREVIEGASPLGGTGEHD